MRLIAGLGNMGEEYEWTPHNVGFLAIDVLAERHAVRVSRAEAKALVGRGVIAGHEVILAKPRTMMNLSGVAVRMLIERFECEPSETIVLLDEIDLPWGMLRIRDCGRNSTHNGLKSIIAALGTDEFIRVRMGVRPTRIWGDRKDYLLSTMSRDERLIAERMAVDAADAVEAVLTEGLSKAMSRFNRKVLPEEDGQE